MRVGIWPAGGENDGTSQYRLMLPAAPLKADGHDITIDMRGPTCYWSKQWTPGPQGPPADVQLLGCEKPPYDVVVMQRPGRRWWSDLIPYLKQHGVRVVVDVDDLFDQIDDGNVAKRSYQPGKNPIHSFEFIDRACRLADVVTVTTEALLQRYGYGHGLVLPNLIPATYLDLDAGATRFMTVGWSGTVETHPHDLQVTKGAIGQVLSQSGWGFHVVGTGKGVQHALRLPEPPTASGWVKFAEYPAALSEMALGIVPLANTPFNRAKSCLKVAEMASLNVPVVMSPTPDNLRLHKLGVGLVASNRSQWVKHLTDLIKSPSYRLEVIENGREAIATQTYEQHADRWWTAWTKTVRAAKKVAA